MRQRQRQLAVPHLSLSGQERELRLASSPSPPSLRPSLRECVKGGEGEENIKKSKSKGKMTEEGIAIKMFSFLAYLIF